VSSGYSDPVFGRMLGKRIVVLGAEVNAAVASTVVSQLLLLATEAPTEEIRLYINSPGGSLAAGFAVYDTIRAVPVDVSTWATGEVSSVAQFLLCAGTPGKRHALPTARIVMREPSVDCRPEVSGGWRAEMVRLMASHTGQHPSTIERDLTRGRVFTAPEARDYGIVDDIVPGTPGAPDGN
jgi:ATP-dependent Clp protease protease subunit